MTLTQHATIAVPEFTV